MKEICLKSPTSESAGAVIFNSASIVLKAAKVTEPDGELLMRICEFQPLLE